MRSSSDFAEEGTSEFGIAWLGPQNWRWLAFRPAAYCDQGFAEEIRPGQRIFVANDDPQVLVIRKEIEVGRLLRKGSVGCKR
jgi:hypothetical protein